MDQTTQQRYYDLRKQLSALNYNCSFGVDALDVVAQLFADLVATNKSYSQVHDKELQLTQELSLAQTQLFPLRKENAKLLRENQQLHLENIKVVEDASLQREAADLSNKQLNDRVREITFIW
jgi:centrosomal protein CEP135